MSREAFISFWHLLCFKVPTARPGPVCNATAASFRTTPARSTDRFGVGCPHAQGSRRVGNVHEASVRDLTALLDDASPNIHWALVLDLLCFRALVCDLAHAQAR